MTFAERLEIALYRFFLGFWGTSVPKAIAELFPAPINSEDDVYKTDDKSRVNVYRRLARYNGGLVEGDLSADLSKGKIYDAFMRVERGEKIVGDMTFSGLSCSDLCDVFKFIKSRNLGDHAELYRVLVSEYVNADRYKVLNKKVRKIVAENWKKFVPIIVNAYGLTTAHQKRGLRRLFLAVLSGKYAPTENEGDETKQARKGKIAHFKKCYDEAPSAAIQKTLLEYCGDQISLNVIYSKGLQDAALFGYFAQEVGVFKLAGDEMHEKEVFALLDKAMKDQQYFMRDIIVNHSGKSVKDLIIHAIKSARDDSEVTENLIRNYKDRLSDEEKGEILDAVLSVNKKAKIDISLVHDVLDALGERGKIPMSDATLKKLGEDKYEGCKEGVSRTFAKTSACKAFLEHDFLTEEELNKINNKETLDLIDQMRIDEYRKNKEIMARLGIQGKDIPTAVNSLVQSMRAGALDGRGNLFNDELKAKWISSASDINAEKYPQKLHYRRCTELLNDLDELSKQREVLQKV